MEGFAAIARELSALLGDTCASEPEQRIAGGSIHACYRWSASRGLLFVKVAARASAPAFAAEAEGLTELAAARAVRVPQVRAHGHTDRAAFLALEWIEAGIGSRECERRLGAGLAALHEVTAERFGWKCDNTIGRTPQANGWLADWAEFFRERRLRPQLDLAIENGFAGALGDCGEQLLEKVPALLSGHAPRASLLHGDLWSGNWMVCAQGHPVIFDPAVYFGDRETDLAMTRLFGGFGAGFYRAYEAAAPLPTGAHERAELYNLYHVLNHANLFGGGYARQARAIIDRLLARLQA